METELTIVMYHYVRDFSNTSWPRIKGLDIKGFCAQLDYLQKNANIVDFEAIKACVRHGEPLPPNPCWLTFDDGYKDHFDYVLPELSRRGLRASFFPPARVIEDRVLLDVNKIHYILASTQDVDGILARLRKTIDDEREHNPQAKSFECYWKQFAVAGRYDSQEIIFIKRMLQVGLPHDMREQTLDSLFKAFVTADPANFAEDLYMSRDNLTELLGASMHVGSHGYNHVWLNHLDAQEQAQEIDRSLVFLDSLGARSDGSWAMCYPYGGYDLTTLSLLADRGCLCGVTTSPGVCKLDKASLLTLSRLDTNDLPQS